MTSQPGYEAVTIHTFSNIWRSKSSQTRKYGQLIEYNMKNIFVEKSCSKCDGETISTPFCKKSKLSIPLDH